MIIHESGKIRNTLYVIGPAAIPVYLLDGPAPILFDGGFTGLAFHYENEIKKILRDRTPAYLFLTHSHFDHVGAVGHFKEIWPNLKIGGSVRCNEILLKQTAVQLMKELNREGTKNLEAAGILHLNRQPFEPFDMDLLIRPDQKIELPFDMTLMCYNTPGHTWDFISYWIPEEKILIASEAVACYQNDGYIQTEFLIDFDAYLDSLTKLKALGATILCAGHHAVFTDQDVIRHINASVEATNQYLEMTEGILNDKKGDIDRSVERVKAVEWDDRPWPKQPESAYLLNTRQRVKTIWARMNKHRE